MRHRYVLAAFVLCAGLPANAAIVWAQAPKAQVAAEKAADASSSDTSPSDNPLHPHLDPAWFKELKWRSIGPASMGGRIIDLAVVESKPSTFYVATATGGLFKTINNGVTFTPQFQHESTSSIGDVCVAPSSPEILWLGTGEHNGRNSSTWGDGVYRSTDGGQNWKNMGLKKTYQIGRIAVHPQNPYVVYVGAIGRLWGENEDRGVYKTTDGGETWEKTLYVDARTGCIDLQICPDDPETLIAAMYERQRDEYDVGDPAKRWGPGSGLYKTTDGGKNWRKLTKGLPTVKMGRIGIDYYRKDPRVVFAIIETENIGKGPAPKADEKPAAFMGMQGQDIEGGARLTRITSEGPSEKAGLKVDDIIVAMNDAKVASYNELLAQLDKHRAGDKVKVQIKRGEDTLSLELTFGARQTQQPQGGSALPFGVTLGGQAENVQSRQGEDGFQTGGLFKSIDGGESWERINSINPRPFYYSQVRVDPSNQDNIYVLGIALFRSTDGGRRFSNDAGQGVHSDHHALWIDPRDGKHLILGCDGGLYASWDGARTWDFHGIMAISQFYHVAVDTREPYWVYGGLQDNGSWGGPSMMRGREGPHNSDWMAIGGGDGFVCQIDQQDPDIVYYESQYGVLGRVNMKTGERGRLTPPTTGGRPNRFNWKTPFILSSHNSKIYYCAGNYVFRSLDRGEKLRTISPEITRTNRGSATALAESPVNPDVLYVGTDDGYLWVTRNGGDDWENVTEALKLPGPRGISTVEASRFAEGRCYLCVDGHRNDDDAPYLFMTNDFGKTWQPLQANLPSGSTKTLREDVKNPDLLYCGTEFGMYVSINRGARWTRLNGNLPTVAVHEIAVHPTAGEIVAATHGRGLWILEVTPLRQLTDKALTAKAFLFQPTRATAWSSGIPKRTTGHKLFYGENPNAPASLYYALTETPKEASLKITDLSGKVLRTLEISKEPGLHRVAWDMRLPPERTGGFGGGSRAGAGESPQGGSERSTAPAAAAQPGQGESVQTAGQPATSAQPGQGQATPTGPTSRPGTSGQPPTGQRTGGGRPGGFARVADPGVYRVVLTVDGQELTQNLTLIADPIFPTALSTEEIEIEEWQGKERHFDY